MFDFCAVGIFLIWCVFYLDLKNISNILLIAGVGALFVSYFTKNVEILAVNVSFNAFVLIGIVLIMCSLCIGCEKISRNICVCGTMLSLFLYVGVVVMMSICLSSFFTPIPLCVIVCATNILNFKGLKSKYFALNLSIIFCEFFNGFYLLKKLDFVAIFSSEIVLCIVLCNLTMITLDILLNIVKVVKNEKVC